jgi:hypothetical protein
LDFFGLSGLQNKHIDELVVLDEEYLVFLEWQKNNR